MSRTDPAEVLRPALHNPALCCTAPAQAGVCFLTLTERGYPKKLAFQYLDELAGEFNSLYAGQVDSATRPYAFIKFGA